MSDSVRQKYLPPVDHGRQDPSEPPMKIVNKLPYEPYSVVRRITFLFLDVGELLTVEAVFADWESIAAAIA
jgi:hypothetical protein